MEELATKMGISQPSLSSIVNGNPTLAKLKSLADAMEISVPDLLMDDKDKQTIICPHCGKVIKVSKEEG